ncbi:MAG: D-alanyl-D-alanine carboxypeptidase family protein [Actinomycetota bacterium]
MTIIIAAFTLTLSLLLGTFVSDVGRVIATRARAQLAADAAALAAVAEGGPYGAGDATMVAREFAEANGAELVRCECPAGTEVVQVEVTIDGVTASARAAIDPSLFGPANVLGVQRGLHPRVAESVERLIRAAGGAVRLVSGWRSPERQEVLWSNALARHGSPEAADDWVARPGHSMHERGLAVDLGGDLALAARLVGELGLPLYRPLANEPWHFELVGSRG